jgi:parvulin-like peptidyl-prolyl isomerase
MAPKNKGKAKDAGESKGDAKGKLKPATSINVRHILCEKHSKKEEALEKLRNGAKFDEVAREMSEDKARQGEYIFVYSLQNSKLTITRWEFGMESERELVSGL